MSTTKSKCPRNNTPSETANNESKEKIAAASTSVNKMIDVENDDDEFCDCDLQEPVSFVSCDPSNTIVAKIQNAIQSVTSIFNRPSDTTQAAHEDSSVKVLMPPTTKSSEYCEPHTCGTQISMAALVDKIKESVPCLSKVVGNESLCDKMLGKCKSLEGKPGYEKPCILLHKLNGLKNNVAEMHKKLQGIIPRVCMTFDKANKRVIVTPGKPCDNVVAQCQGHDNSIQQSQCKREEDSPIKPNQSEREETYPSNSNQSIKEENSSNNSSQGKKEENQCKNPSLPPKPSKKEDKHSDDSKQSIKDESSNQCKKEDRSSHYS